MNIPTFKEICDQMVVTHTAKNTDYGSSWNNYQKFLGLPPSVGLMSRILDKVGRACNIMRAGKAVVESESIKDTMLDLAVYSVLTYIELCKEEEQECKPGALAETQCFSTYGNLGSEDRQE